MNLEQLFCPNIDCPARGQANQGNLAGCRKSPLGVFYAPKTGGNRVKTPFSGVFKYQMPLF